MQTFKGEKVRVETLIVHIFCNKVRIIKHVK